MKTKLLVVGSELGISCLGFAVRCDVRGSDHCPIGIELA